MEVSLNSLVPFENLFSDTDNVFQRVDNDGKVVLVKDNRPAYIIVKYVAEQEAYIKEASGERPNYTLQEAMKIVLLETTARKMHAAELAETIFKRKLYLKKDGTKAKYNQIRARSGHYPHLFEALPGNIIKLKEDI